MPTDTSTTSNGAAPSESGRRIEQAASDIAEHAGRTAEREASRAMDRAGDALEQVARAVREGGNQLRAERPEIADVAQTAADRVESVSTYLREHDAREVVAQAEQLARRQPALVIGGGLLIGLVAGRLLRSSVEPADSRPGLRGGSGTYLRGGGSYAGTPGWSGGSASDASSTRPEGVTMPGSGYGTGYGASGDGTGGSGGDTGLIADTSETTTTGSRQSSSRASAPRRSRSTSTTSSSRNGGTTGTGRSSEGS